MLKYFLYKRKINNSMALCKMSSQAVINEKTQVDNLFINNFLPNAPENCVKVYLYGLYKCNNAQSLDNSLESFSQNLNIPESELESIFFYWQEQGLVQVTNTNPFEVLYLPLKNLFSNIKKYKPEKFAEFNVKVQEILNGRMIYPNEYAEYYYLIENTKFEQNALLLLIGYCVQIKGANVGVNYITTVANNWASENIKTAQKVEEKINELNLVESNFGILLKSLGIKRNPTIEEREMWNVWTKQLGFDEETILFVAKYFKSSKRLNFEKLDNIFKKYFEMRLFTQQEISSFEKQHENYVNIAKQVNSNLGLFYENLEPVVENYIVKWVAMGFEEDGLKALAEFCFKKSIRTLEGMNAIVNKFFKLGTVSLQSINQYFEDMIAYDEKIKTILIKLNLNRNVNNWDRSFYKTWTEDWKINDQLFAYAIELSKDKIQPMNYLNKTLSSFYEMKIQTVEDAKKLGLYIGGCEQKSTLKGRSYTASELNSLFDSLDELEV